MLRFLIPLAFLVVCVVPLSAQTPTFEESINMKSVRGPLISPDGAFVAYGVQGPDWEKNSYVSQIHIADVESGRRFQLTVGKKSAGSYRWSPDGRWLSFAASRDGDRQIYLISPRGGEAWRLSKHKGGVGAHEWAPDGKWIAFVAEEEQEEDEEKKVKVVEVDAEHRMQHLWRLAVPVEPGDAPVEAERLTEGTAYSVSGFRWAPDSTRIAFSGRMPPKYEWRDTDIFVLELGEKPEESTVKRIVTTPGPDSGPIWSPDGHTLAYSTSNGEEFYYYTNREIALIPATGGTSRVITANHDENAWPIDWNERGIFFSSQDKTANHLYRLHPDTEEITRMTGPDRAMYWSFSFTRDVRAMAFYGAGVNEVAEIWLSPVTRFSPRRLTDNRAQYMKFSLGAKEVISWKSKDGTVIEGILQKPADYDPNRKYPLLVKIHGGPTGCDRPFLSADRYYPLERFLAKGALVLMVNYRGSSGYGSHFRQLNVRNLGVGDSWDVISGCDHLIERGLVDPKRMGAMGWSQGGYISAFLATYCNRFQAVSMGAGISDWMTYYVNTDIHPFTRQYLKATPWEDPDIYQKTSPVGYVNQATTPVLIQHGEKDQRVPIPNAYQMYQALQDREVPVKMYVFEGYGHGINTPREQKALLEQNYRWFLKWIWGEEWPEKRRSMTVL